MYHAFLVSQLVLTPSRSVCWRISFNSLQLVFDHKYAQNKVFQTMNLSFFTHFPFIINTKALLAINIFVMDNYLILSLGSTTALSSLKLFSNPIFTILFVQLLHAKAASQVQKPGITKGKPSTSITCFIKVSSRAHRGSRRSTKFPKRLSYL